MKRLFEKAFKMPFKQEKYGSWVNDSDYNFCFQFELDDKEIRSEVMAALNTTYKPTMFTDIYHENGLIRYKNKELILIRGWGYLTGVGGLNLPDEEAAAIQDDLADYIIERLKS